jgi:membrane-bound serine protease (ClpP class)
MARRVWMALLFAPVLLAATPVATPPASPSPAARASGPVLQLTIDGTINAATVTYVRDGLHQAQARGAAALLIQRDTPGGLLESTKLIVKDMLGATLPVRPFIRAPT